MIESQTHTHLAFIGYTDWQATIIAIATPSSDGRLTLAEQDEQYIDSTNSRCSQSTCVRVITASLAACHGPVYIAIHRHAVM